MPGTPAVLHAGVSGLPLSGSDYNDNWFLIEQSFLSTGPYIISGLALSAGPGLSVNVSSGTAVVGAYRSLAAFSIGSLTDGVLNYLYLLENGAATSNTTGVAPASSALLGTASTAGGVVTAVNMGRSSGRQQIVAVQNLVPGGPSAGTPSAGHPASVNLANWSASPGEGIAVYGTLPAGGAGGSSASFVTPNNALYSWVNQGSATVTVLQGAILLRSPFNAAENLRLRVKAIPAAPYTVTVALLPSVMPENFAVCGLVLRDSVGGGLVTFDASRYNTIISGAGHIVYAGKYNSPTSFNAAYTLTPAAPPAVTFQAGMVMWLRIQDDGTNRIFFASNNGLSWFQLLSVVRTDFITPDQIGFYVESGLGTLLDCGLDLYSWQEA